MADVKSKFFEDNDGKGMEYGTTDVFFRGLDGFIGPPNPLLRVTVEQEHCHSEDSFAHHSRCPTIRRIRTRGWSTIL